MKRSLYFFLVTFSVLLFIPASSGRPREAQSVTPSILQSSPRADMDYGKIPLQFVPNWGQTDPSVAFYVRGRDKTVYFMPEGLAFVLKGAKEQAERRRTDLSEGWVLKLDFLGSNPEARPVGAEESGTLFSFFQGKPEEWREGLAGFSKILYRDLWPGIDLLYSGTFERMKYEFIVHPGADPSRIKMAYRGAEAVTLTPEGRLSVITPAGGFEDDIPLAWQVIDGQKVDIHMAYQLAEPSASRTFVYGFEVGEYDRDRPLVLDPALLIYCGFVGGSGDDYGVGIAVDGSGNAYITGDSYELSVGSFPLKEGPSLTYGGGDCDAFVAKINASGTDLVYCGYIGGSGYDVGNAIAVDASGNAYVTGYTTSAEDFPVQNGPYLAHGGGEYDAFVAKVNASGTGLVYCGYIGGESNDHGKGIGVDGSGNAYIAGYTNSETSFPVRIGPSLTYGGGLSDAFVAKVNASGTDLVYCGYIGGSGYDEALGLAVDNSGCAYLVGDTNSTGLPVRVGPFLSYGGGYSDAFVAKVNASGTDLVYCGYIGGSDEDGGNAIAVDSSGNAYVTGYTRSSESTFPVKTGPGLAFSGQTDVFVAKVDASGAELVYCGYIGGEDHESGFGIAVDPLGNAYITGYTYSSVSFPSTGDLNENNNGSGDAFVAKVNASGAGLAYCGYIGGFGYDYGLGIAVDRSGNAYVTGITTSSQSSFPVVTGPDPTFNGAQDAFVAKILAYEIMDFVGTWDGQGVYYRNSDTGAWVKMASPATMITTGDLDGDGIDDLIGLWPTQGGIWVKYSQSGSWVRLSSTAVHIAAGDMNGDGRIDLLGTWDGQGVYYRDSVTGAWVKMASPATMITAGDIDGDGTDDLIGIWPTQGGVWVKYSSTGAWARLSSTARDIAAGDMNGDGRDDLLATWDGQGVFYRDSVTGAWLKMASQADQVTCGYIDEDHEQDLIGIWPTQGGVWVKFTTTNSWARLSSTARDITAGTMRPAGGSAAVAQTLTLDLAMPSGGIETGPEGAVRAIDEANMGPGGRLFNWSEEQNLLPVEGRLERLSRAPGPGDPHFVFIEQDKLYPADSRETGRPAGPRKKSAAITKKR